MKFYYDCEFLEDGRTIELISIGMVNDEGREYYAVSADMPQERIKSHDWLRENVWPHLPLKEVNGESVIDTDDPIVKPRAVIADEVRDFILSGSDDHRELWAYYGAYDHVALCQLWGKMIDLPNGIPMFTHELMQLWEDAGRPEKPNQTNEHDALADARWNRELYRLCQLHTGQ